MSEKEHFNTNSVCTICRIRFNASLEELLVCDMCEQVFHKKCYESIKFDQIDKFIHLNCVSNKEKYSMILESDVASKISQQKHIDIVSLKRTNFKPSFEDYLRGLMRLPYMLFHFGIFYFDYYFKIYNQKRFYNFLDAVAYGLNIQSTIVGKEKIDNSIPKIYISNHVSYHDILTIPKYIDTGAIASISTRRHIITQILEKYKKSLFIKRGDSNRDKPICDQMNEFIENNGSLLICPQGLLGKYNIISKFRTGGFTTKFPIQPIVLKYKQDVSSMSAFDIFLFKRVDVEIHVLDIIYNNNSCSPKDFAEKTRIMMANKCELLLSNVDSHDIAD